MRWLCDSSPQLISNDTRIKKRFLFFPKCIKNNARWLEICEFEETYTEIVTYSHHVNMNLSTYQWVATKWIS